MVAPGFDFSSCFYSESVVNKHHHQGAPVPVFATTTCQCVDRGIVFPSRLDLYSAALAQTPGKVQILGLRKVL